MDPKRRAALTHSIAALVAAVAVWFGKGAVSTPPSTTPPKDSTVVTAPPVTTPPDTTSTVTPPPATLNYVVVHGDDFTGYITTQDFLKRVTTNIGGSGTSNLLYTDGANPTLASIDESVQYNGHHTLKYSQPGGVPNTPELWVGISPALPHVWARAHIRWMPGWTTIGTGMTHGDNGALVTSSAAYKMLGWDYGGVDGSGRIEITNTTEYQDYFGASKKTGGAATPGCNSHDQKQTLQVASEWTDGKWYTYIVEVDNTVSPAISRFYMGGATGKPTLKLTCTAAWSVTPVPGVDAINFGMNYNQVRKPDQIQSLNYGDWEIVDGSKYANPFGV